MTARRSGTLAVALVATATLVAVLLVAWSASIGPGQVIHDQGSAPRLHHSPEPTDSTSPTDETEPETPRPQSTDADRSWWLLAVLLNVAAALTVAALVVWGGRTALRARRVRRRHAAERRAADDALPPLEPAAVVAEALRADAAAQRDVLDRGSPRNAVVACWHRFEVSAAEAGVERRPWETSSEHVLRMLDLVDADSAAVARLAALYREARFSEHELTEADRAAAREALDVVHASIRAGHGAPA